MIVASPEVQLATPLMLLLNGGEETILTAAHGFMKTSKWAPRVGAFINLESTGPGGPDILFQHTGRQTYFIEPKLCVNYGGCMNMPCMRHLTYDDVLWQGVGHWRHMHGGQSTRMDQLLARYIAVPCSRCLTAATGTGL